MSYDVPRDLKNPTTASASYDNYDFPLNGSLPVYRKKCGCVMRLVHRCGRRWQF